MIASVVRVCDQVGEWFTLGYGAVQRGRTLSLYSNKFLPHLQMMSRCEQAGFSGSRRFGDLCALALKPPTKIKPVSNICARLGVDMSPELESQSVQTFMHV